MAQDVKDAPLVAASNGGLYRNYEMKYDENNILGLM